jgi:U3 small nucleolar RNA-associated protein 22
MDPILSLPNGITENYGTGEEKLADAVNAFNEFSSILKNLKELPLSINNINGLSSIFRYTDVYAPLPCYFNYDQAGEKNMCYKFKNKNFPKYPLGPVIIPYVKPLKIACQLESSGKWPENIECIKRLKTAFYIKIAQLLRESQGLTAYPQLDHCDIVYKGFVFRVLVFTMSELLCLKSSINEQGILCTVESRESIEYEKNMTFIPKLTSYLHG